MLGKLKPFPHSLSYHIDTTKNFLKAPKAAAAGMTHDTTVGVDGALPPSPSKWMGSSWRQDAIIGNGGRLETEKVTSGERDG